MVDLIHRCSICNQYTTIKVSDDNYFNYLLTDDINTLNIDKLNKLLIQMKLCNKCKIARERRYNC